jgi:Mce-associated membrane protein
MSGSRTRRIAWWTLVLVLIVGIVSATGFGVWQAVRTYRVEQPPDTAARDAVLEVGKSTTIAMLSYTAENVENQLNDSLSLLTGEFRETYDKLIHDTVIPSARQQKISTTAQVPGAAVESISRDRATLILFINQTTTTGTAEPTTSASSVRMGLQKIDDKWLVDKFDPL